MRKRYFGFLTAALLILVMAAPGLAARKTRDLVFDEEDTQAEEAKAKSAGIQDPSVLSVRTTLELTRDGQISTVSPSHEFKSGDRVRLRYTTNADGYVYWLAKMSSGKYNVLFPSPQAGMDNFIRKNTEHTVPVKGSFRFDDKPGTENIMVVFAPNKVPELEQAVAEASGQKGNVNQSATSVAAVEDKNAGKRKTRDLVFEEEDDEAVNTKTQVVPKGDPFVESYALVHR